EDSIRDPLVTGVQTCALPVSRFGAPLHRHITAADFKYSIERLFQVASPAINFYRHIVGADSVLAGRATTLPGVIARGDSLYIRRSEERRVGKALSASCTGE